MVNKFVPVIFLSVLTVGLVSCSSKTASVTPGAAIGSDAQSYAWRGDDDSVVKDSDGADMQGRLLNRYQAPVNQTYYFDLDSNQVTAKDRSFIALQARYLSSHPKAKIRLEGNTDERGSREYNIGLGWRRDQAIARLIEGAGVRPTQINMVSYGKERPAVLGQVESVWRLNRRVVLVYEGY